MGAGGGRAGAFKALLQLANFTLHIVFIQNKKGCQSSIFITEIQLIRQFFPKTHR